MWIHIKIKKKKKSIDMFLPDHPNPKKNLNFAPVVRSILKRSDGIIDRFIKQ